MAAATMHLVNPSSWALSIPECCISTVPMLYTTTTPKASYPFLSLHSKATRPIHLSSVAASSSYLSSWVSPRNKSSTSNSVPFVAQTSDWAQQEEGSPTVDGVEAAMEETETNEDEVEEETEEEVGSEEEGGEVESYTEPPEEAKLFVGNLPFDVDSEKLAELFNQAGVVEIAEVIYNRDTDQSRGFGFVTMSTVEDAEVAVEKMHRYDLDGRLLTVNKAAPKGSRPERAPRVFENSLRIYVGNLPWQVDNARLEQVFSEHGKVVDARVVYDRESGRSRGFGFVTMSSETELNDAIAALDGQSLDGRAIRVNVAEDRPRRSFF